MMFGLDASKKKINKVWNQRRAASARAGKASASVTSGAGVSSGKGNSNAVSTSSSATSSVLSGQQRSASFRYSRPRVEETVERRKRSGHSSDLDDDDEDDLPLGSSSFTRSTRARFKSQQLHHSTSPHVSTSAIVHNSQSNERSVNKTNLPPINTSPINRTISSNKDSTDLSHSSLPPSSPVTCVANRYSFSLGSYDHHHYSNYEWIDANGLTVPPPDPAALSCAPCEDIEVQLDPGISLGLTVRGGSEYGLGIFISYIDKRSAAASAGLAVGDQILALNNMPWDTSAGITLESAVNTIKRYSSAPASGSPIILLFTIKRVGKVPSASIVSEEAVASAPSMHSHSGAFSIVRKKSLIPSSRCSSSASTVSSTCNTANQTGYHSFLHHPLHRKQSTGNMHQTKESSSQMHTSQLIQSTPGSSGVATGSGGPVNSPGSLHQVSQSGHASSSHHSIHQSHMKSASLTAVPSAVAMEEVTLMDRHTASHLSMSHCIPNKTNVNSLIHPVDQLNSSTDATIDTTARLTASHSALNEQVSRQLYRRPSAMTLMPPSHTGANEMLLSPTSAAILAEEASAQRRFSSASLNRRRCSSLHLNPERKRLLPGIPLTASDMSLTAVGVSPTLPACNNPRRGSILPSIPPTMHHHHLQQQKQQSQPQSQSSGHLIAPPLAEQVPLNTSNLMRGVSLQHEQQQQQQQNQQQPQQVACNQLTVGQDQEKSVNSLFPPSESVSKYKRHSTSSFAMPDASGLLAAAAAAVRRHSSCVMGGRGRSFFSPDPSPTVPTARDVVINVPGGNNETNGPGGGEETGGAGERNISKAGNKRMSMSIDNNGWQRQHTSRTLGMTSTPMYSHSSANLQVPTVNVRRSSVDMDRNSSEDEDDSRLRIPSAGGSARRGSGNHLTIPGMDAVPLYLMLPQVTPRRGSGQQGHMADASSNGSSNTHGHLHARVRRHRSLPSPFISHSLLMHSQQLQQQQQQQQQQQAHQMRRESMQGDTNDEQSKWSGHRYSIVAAAPGVSGMYHTNMYSSGYNGSPTTSSPVRSSSFRRPHHRATVEPGGRIRVNVKKSKPFLGIAIEGGCNVPNQKLPRIISILGSGAAFETGNLHVGHIILEVDCISTENLLHEQIAQMIADAYYKTPHKDYIEFVVREKSKHEFDIRTSSFMLLNSSFE